MRRFLGITLAVAAVSLLLISCGSDSGGDNKGSTPSRTSTGQASAATATTVQETPAMPFSEACQKSDEKTFSSAPPRIIDTAKTYTATITLEKGGNIVVELFSDVPITTNNFVFLACKGYYDGITFHRVLPDFVAQAGDPTGDQPTGAGGPGYAIPDEDDGDHTMDAGVISMAKSGPNTTGSQFFITYTPQPRLEPDFTVFGRVTEGMDVLQSITPRDPQTNRNAPPGDKIATITIAES